MTYWIWICWIWGPQRWSDFIEVRLGRFEDFILFYFFLSLFLESCPSRHLHNSFVQKSSPSHSHTFIWPSPQKAITAVHILPLWIFTLAAHIYACLRICECAFMLMRVSAYIVSIFFFGVFDVFFPKTPWELIPLYLFVRQPDECDWQSYIIISQRLGFYPWRWYERYCWQL